MISKDACKVLIINSVLYCLANGHPQLYTILLQHLSLFIQICNLAKNAKFLPKKQLHLNMGNLASQGLANCGRVAKSVDEASCAFPCHSHWHHGHCHLLVAHHQSLEPGSYQYVHPSPQVQAPSSPQGTPQHPTCGHSSAAHQLLGNT